MPRERSRHLRVGAELGRLLNQLLQSEVKDPRLHDVRITGVDLSGDLGVARIYYSFLRPDENPDDAAEAFVKAMGFLRRRVASELNLRRVPELRFIHDESARRGMEISQLLDAIQPKADGNDDDEPIENQ